MVANSMPSTYYTSQIEANSYIGDALGTINGNFSQLGAAVCELSGSLSNVREAAVRGIYPGINTSVNPLSAFDGDLTIFSRRCPEWHIGATGLPLHLETGANRVSQQAALSARDFLRHLSDTVAFNPPMPGAEVISYSSASHGIGAEGGIMLADGSIFILPRSGGTAKVYEPLTDSYKSIASVPSGTWSSGGILMSDGRVLLIPQSQNAQIYNPATDTYSQAQGSNWTASEWYSGVLLPSGKVYINPRENGAKALIYDPADSGTPTVLSSNNSKGCSGSCVLLPNGTVYRIPGYNTGYSPPSTVAQIYNPETNSFTDALGTYPSTSQGFHLGQLLADGRVFVAPNDAACNGGRIYNPFARSAEVALTTTTSSNFEGYNDIVYGGCCLLQDGRVVLFPWGGTKAIIYDPSTNTTIAYTTGGGRAGAFMAKNGNVYTISIHGSAMLAINAYHQQEFSSAATTGPHFNKTY